MSKIIPADGGPSPLNDPIHDAAINAAIAKLNAAHNAASAAFYEDPDVAAARALLFSRQATHEAAITKAASAYYYDLRTANAAHLARESAKAKAEAKAKADIAEAEAIYDKAVARIMAVRDAAEKGSEA